MLAVTINALLLTAAVPSVQALAGASAGGVAANDAMLDGHQQDIADSSRTLLATKVGSGVTRAGPPPSAPKKSSWASFLWWWKRLPAWRQASLKKKWGWAPKVTKPAPPTPSPRTSAPGRSAGEGSGQKYNALSTFFGEMGRPYGGCGIGEVNAKDDNGKTLPWVALNTMNPSAPMSYFGPSKDQGWNMDYVGMFDVGANCGRWLKITLGENCVGGGNGDAGPCTSGGARYAADAATGQTVYGYVMDSCADDNYWCRTDEYHVDLSEPYLRSEGLLGDGGSWNGRKISWQFMSGTAPGWSQEKLRFSFKGGSSSHWAVVVIMNVSNGVGMVKRDGQPATRFLHLGSMWQLPGSLSTKTVSLEVSDIDGKSYGKFDVDYPCSGGCGSDTKPVTA